MTGPKARTSQNALKHGLAKTMVSGPGFLEGVESLAHTLAGGSTEAAKLGLARRAAESELELLRIRSYRILLIEPQMKTNTLGDGAQKLGHDANSGTTFAHPVAAVLNGIKRVASLERYERRAFSRRNRLFRELVREIGAV